MDRGGGGGGLVVLVENGSDVGDVSAGVRLSRDVEVAAKARRVSEGYRIASSATELAPSRVECATHFFWNFSNLA